MTIQNDVIVKNTKTENLKRAQNIHKLFFEKIILSKFSIFIMKLYRELITLVNSNFGIKDFETNFS